MSRHALARSLAFASVLCLGALQGIVEPEARAQTSAAPFVTGYRWDAERRLVGKISPYPEDGNPTYYPAERYSYNADGQLQSVETGILSAWQSQTILPSAWSGYTVRKTISYSYDAAGNQVEERVSAGGTVRKVTQMTSDADDRLSCTAVRMNLGAIPATGSDACALGTAGSDGPDRITRIVYDTAGQQLQLRRAVGTTLEQAYVTYSYTSNGKKADVVDANGNRALLAYDGVDRQSRWYFPSKTRPSAFDPTTPATALSTAGAYSATDYEQYGYDRNGNRTSLRKRDAQVIAYSFDAVNRMSIKDIPGGTAADVYYSYDPRGLQLTARFVSAGGQGLTNVYDKAGRLTSSANNVGGTSRTLSYQYDANGNRTRLTYPDGNYATFDYDGIDRMKLVKEGAATSVATISYNDEGERIGLTGGVATAYTYDPLSRLASIAHDLAGTAQDVTYCMGTLSGGSCTASYNPASQALKRTIGNDLYAVKGLYNANRSYAVNGLNQYTAAGNAAPAYDANGNLTAADGTIYGYDVENRLTSATGATAATLTYDPSGRLDTTASAGVTTRFLYDGDALVGEYDAAGTLLRRYVHGPGADEPLLWYEGSAFGSGNRRILRADHQGSIVAIANSGGTSLGINSYDEWGNPGPDNLGRFAYTGQIAIPELKLLHYKARIYNPRLGRFNQVDPVGYDDQFNLYAYVANDPINGTDPTGTTCTQSGDKGAYACQIDKVVTLVKGVLVTRAATAEDHKKYSGIEKALTRAVNAAVAKGGTIEKINFQSGGKSYSFSISTSKITQSLVSRVAVVNPYSSVGAMNTPNSLTTNINRPAINTGPTAWGSAERTRAKAFLHDAIHKTPEEASALGAHPKWGGKLQDDHQDEYNRVADDILGPD